MNSIQFVGGEKGGVGKSVFSRLLAQYFIDKNRPFTAIDADKSHSSLMRFYSDFTQAITMDNAEKTDAIVDLAMENNNTVLVDLPAQSKSELNAWLEKNEILQIADEYNLNIIFWHVIDDSMDSLNLLRQTIDNASDLANYVIVKNYGRGDDFSEFENSQVARDAINKGASIISIKELQPSTMRKVDRLNFSYWAAANNSDSQIGECLGFLERRRVASWLRDSNTQLKLAFDAIENQQAKKNDPTNADSVVQAFPVSAQQ